MWNQTIGIAMSDCCPITKPYVSKNKGGSLCLLRMTIYIEQELNHRGSQNLQGEKARRG